MPQGNVRAFPRSSASVDITMDPESVIEARRTALKPIADRLQEVLQNQFRQQHGGATPPYHSQGISLTTYAPEINLCRDPRWGRCEESRGEDPTLTARLTVTLPCP